MSEPHDGDYPAGPGWVDPGYPYRPAPPARPYQPEPPANPHWIPALRPAPEPDPMHVDRRRGLRLAAVLITAVVVLGVLAALALRAAGH